MAYNNGFPVGYVPPYASPVSPFQLQPPQMQQQQQMQHSGLTWVQGEAGAKSFLVAPNTTVDLWDSEAQTIYLKSADASGMPSMKILDYTVREPNSPPKVQNDEKSDYATKTEVDDIKERMEKVKDTLTHEIDAIKESLGIE